MHPGPSLNRLQPLGQIHDARKGAWPTFARLPSWERRLLLQFGIVDDGESQNWSVATNVDV